MANRLRTTSKELLAFKYHLLKDSSTSAGIFYKDADGDEVLVRTLWNDESRKAGWNYFNWDRKNDAGTVLANVAGYYAKVMHHNVVMQEDGVYANTSRDRVGEFRHTALDPCTGLCGYQDINGEAIAMANGYQEGSYKSFAFLLADPQRRFEINANEGGAGMSFNNICQWHDMLLYAGSSPYINFLSGVWGVDIATRKKVTFVGGAVMDSGVPYRSAIDITRTTTESYITSIAAQLHGDYAFVSRQNIDSLHVLAPGRSQALVAALTYEKAGCLFVKGNYLFMRTGATGSAVVSRYPIGADGAIGPATLVYAGLSNPLAITELKGPNAGILAIADGGTDHDIKFYNAETGERLALGKFKTGSYHTVVLDDNYRLIFSKKTDGSRYPLQQTDIAALEDGGYYITVQGKRAIQRFNHLHEYVEEVAALSRCYNVCRDPHDPRTQTGDDIEFALDSSKPTEQGWKRHRIWSDQIGPEYASTLYLPVTLCNAQNVRMGQYAMIRGKLGFESGGGAAATFYKYDLAQLTDGGLKIWESVTENLDQNLYPDGTLKQFVQNGTNIKFYSTDPCTFVADGEYMKPVFGPLKLVEEADLPAGLYHRSSQGGLPFERTANGQTVLYDADLKMNDQAGEMHMALIKNGKVLKRFNPANAMNDTGPVPRDGRFPTNGYVRQVIDGHDNIQGYAGNRAQVFGGDYILGSYNGEFSPYGQPNLHWLWHECGLLIRMEGHALYEVTVGPRVEGMCGNALTTQVVQTPEGWEFTHGDEGIFQGIHRVLIRGLETVEFINISILPN